MGSINDYKIVAKKSINYSALLNAPKKLTSIEQQRYGFYLLVIAAVAGFNDVDEIVGSIIDTEFCGNILGIKNNDEGIDAVTIDDETHTINLFNFKYREKFTPGGIQKLNDAVGSMKFLNVISSERTENLDARTGAAAKKVIKRLKSGDIWKFKLYMVSNDNHSIAIDDKFINNLKEEYDLEVKSLVLDEIIAYTSSGREDTEATVLVDVDAVMTYEETALSSSKSYLFRMPLTDVIRITSKDTEIRNMYDMADLGKLKDVKLELGLLFENVRGYLGETEYNKNITKTIEANPEKFFMYNNGITITTKKIEAIVRNGAKKLEVKFSGFQIVNGGQTVRSIYAVKNSDFDEEKLSSASVLVRAFQTGMDDTLTNNIAEYTNSQNAISASDLKSVSNLQIQIERYLKEHDIKYIRKSGDVGDDEKSDYKYYISMERLAQIIFAKKGNPDKSSNQKKRLFSKYYDDIFNEETDFDELVKNIVEYEKIKEMYEGKGSAYEQKYFYVLYLNGIRNDFVANIQLVEEILKQYKSDEDISEARKLIQRGFKDLLDASIAPH